MAKRSTKKVSKRHIEPPTCSCLIFCEDVTISIGKRLHDLHGVITDMFIPDLAQPTGVGVVYMRLRNVYASQQFNLRFSNADTMETMFQFTAESSQQSDPNGNHVIIVPIPPIRFPSAGRYVFNLMHGGDSFAECLVTVATAEANQSREQ